MKAIEPRSSNLQWLQESKLALEEAERPLIAMRKWLQQQLKIGSESK